MNQVKPDLVAELLDFPRLTLEERVIELPGAGPVHLAIFRTGPGSARSMDLLEHGVRTAEDLVGEPFPPTLRGGAV